MTEGEREDVIHCIQVVCFVRGRQYDQMIPMFRVCFSSSTSLNEGLAVTGI